MSNQKRNILILFCAFNLFLLLGILLFIGLHWLSREVGIIAMDFDVTSAYALLWIVSYILIGLSLGGGIGVILYHYFYSKNRKQDNQAIADLKQRLKDQENWFYSITAYSKDAIVIMDGQGKVHLWNQSATQIFGYTYEEIIGKDLHSFILSDRKKKNFQHDIDVFTKTGKGKLIGRTINISAKRKNETEVDIEAAFSSFQVKGVWYAMAIIRDVTERKQSEENLKILAQAVEQSIDSIIYSDTNGIVKFVNQSAASMHGYAIEELIGKHISVFHTKEQIKEDILPLIQNLASQGNAAGEIRRIKKDGTLLHTWMSITIVRDFNGVSVGLLGIIRDITDTKKAMENLRESEKQLRDLTNSLPQPICEMDVFGKFTFINKAASDFFGYSKDEIEHHLNILDFIHPEDRETVIANINHLIQSRRQSVPHIYKALKRDGTLISIITFTSPIIKQNKVEGLRSIMVDISEQKKIQDELQEALESARNAEKLKSSFLANMSHEIRTPLNGIIGFVDLMLEDANFPDEYRDNLTIVKDSGNLLLSLINDILELSKIEAGQIKIENISFDLKSLMDKTGYNTQILISKRESKVKLKQNISYDITPNIISDPTRLKQILNNLLSNAVKFTRKGYIEFGVELRDKDNLLFYVKDTGIGIPPDRQRDIFNPFQQADPSITRKFGGTGLGLTISHKLVQTMGGELWLESKVNQGTTFYFSLPYNPTDLPQEEEEESKEIQEVKTGYTIMLVEDNEVSQKVTTKILEKNGYKVVIATDGKQALAVLNSDRNIDLILMDIQMPEMDGLQTTRIIRDNEKQEAKENKIPIIALTAGVLTKNIKDCKEAGCDEYLSKPLNINKLISTIQKYIN